MRRRPLTRLTRKMTVVPEPSPGQMIADNMLNLTMAMES
jgi:hypothetical protein